MYKKHKVKCNLSVKNGGGGGIEKFFFCSGPDVVFNVVPSSLSAGARKKRGKDAKEGERDTKTDMF